MKWAASMHRTRSPPFPALRLRPRGRTTSPWSMSTGARCGPASREPRCRSPKPCESGRKDRLGIAARTLRRGDSQGSQARQHHDHCRWARKAPRFRPREIRRGGRGRRPDSQRQRSGDALGEPDAPRRDPRHFGLHVSRAGAWPGTQSSLGHLFLRHGAVRNADRPAGIQWSDAIRCPRFYPEGPAAPRVAGQPRGPGGAG